MATLSLPLSGNVTQSILPWTWMFNQSGGQTGLVNIELGQSSAPTVEKDVLNEVASYGKQLGRIEDALLVVLDKFKPAEPLTPQDEAAIAALQSMATEIKQVKARHGR